MTTKLFEQGDVLIFYTEKIPEGKREMVVDGVLAAGEATGHHHRIAIPTVTKQLRMEKTTKAELMPRLFRVNGVLYVEAPEPFRVTHEEHKPIDVPAGNYRIGIVQEYDYDAEEARNVAD